LLSRLQQIFIVQSAGQKYVRYYPGNCDTGNAGSISRVKQCYRLTRFGQKIYTSLLFQDRPVLKIDKQVIIETDQDCENLKIYPAVTAYEYSALKKQFIIITVAGNSLKLPLIWKQGELFFYQLRLRWLFKKDRFQFTLKKNKTDAEISINDEKLSWDRQDRIKYYYSNAVNENIIALRLLNTAGRTYFLNDSAEESTAVLSGWLANRNGLLADVYNIIIDRKQKSYIIAESGQIRQTFKLTGNTDKIEIRARKISQTIQVKRIADRALAGLLAHTPADKGGLLIVFIATELWPRRAEIANLLQRELAFIPQLLPSAELKSRSFCRPQIHLIRQRDNRFPELQKPSSGYLTVINYEDGMEEIIGHLFKEKGH
jgi:hypothetical protein